MKKVLRVVVVFLVVVVALGALGATGAWFFARSSLPAYGTSLAVAGLLDEVTVYRDDYGIPHIFAANTHDMFFAQGYCQAQDRLWEMDLSRRAVQGRLAEIFGEDYVDADYFLRTLGFYRAAEASLPGYPPEAVAAAQAFADGINAFLSDPARKLPVEFSILGYEPEPWVTTDSAAIGKYMAWVLGGNMETELFNLAAANELTPAVAAGLFPVYPSDGPVTTMVPFEGFGETVPVGSEGSEARPSDLDVATGAGTAGAGSIGRLLAVIGQARLGLGSADTLGLGSNNWVVAGQHTASGKPLLANDMHLDIQQPSIWYQNHISCPEMNVTGVIFPGIPGVIVGHNDRIAWGVTNVGPDVQDLYVERPNPDDPHQFEYNGVWETAQVYVEQIRVKDLDEPVVKEVVVTRHGPIISEVVGTDDEEEQGQEDTAGEQAPPLPPLALRWTALDPTCELAAVLGFDQAQSWDDFRAALESFQAPAQNFVFADVDGNIAYRANGLIPIRTEAHRRAGNGLLPVPGWTSDYEWRSYIAWDDLPSLENPEAGLIVTANQRVTAPDYPYFISAEWSAPYRAASIWAELSGREGLTPEDMEAIQNDVTDLQAARLWPAIESAVDPTALSPLAKEAWDIFAGWASDDPQDLASSPGPTIFHTFYLEAVRAVFGDELGEDLLEQFVSAGSPSNLFDTMVLEGASAANAAGDSTGDDTTASTGMAGRWAWFDNTATTDAVETMGDTLTAAFDTAVARLSESLGGSPAKWTWGRVHTVTLDHPMGSVAVLGLVLNIGPFPSDGSGVTACAKGYSPEPLLEDGPVSFAVDTGAPWRFVADLSDLGHCYDVQAGGISGQPFGRHYSDQTELWLGGGYKPMLFDRGEIEALEGVEVTVLSPVGG